MPWPMRRNPAATALRLMVFLMACSVGSGAGHARPRAYRAYFPFGSKCCRFVSPADPYRRRGTLLATSTRINQGGLLMAKTRQSNETAKALVSPLFAWTNAMLKSGQMMLDSVGTAARNANNIRVAVLHDVDAPLRRATRSKANGRTRRAKR